MLLLQENADTAFKMASDLKLRLRLPGQWGQPIQSPSSNSAPDSI